MKKQTNIINAFLFLSILSLIMFPSISQAQSYLDNWTSKTSGTSAPLNGIAYGTNTFAAVGNSSPPGDPVIFTSTDGGTTWVARDTTPLNTSHLYGINYVNGNFVGVGHSGKVVYSSNGTTWNYVSSATDCNQIFSDLTYGSGLYYAIGLGGADGGFCYSSNLTTWDNLDLFFRPTAEQLFGIIFANSTFIVVGANGTIVTSSNGINWTSQISGTTEILTDIAYGNGLYVAVGYNDTVVTSPDYVTWTVQVLGTGTGENLEAISFGHNTFLAVGSNGTIVSSPDGVNWTDKSPGFPYTDNLYDAVYDTDTFIVVGANGTILQSDVADTTPPTTTAAPAGGIYTSSQSVTLTCVDADPGCDKIYYTTDGLTPDLDSSVYSAPISITESTVLQFFATDLDNSQEAVQIEEYTISGTTLSTDDGGVVAPVLVDYNNDVTLTFTDVTISGNTSVTISGAAPAPPAGFNLIGDYYDFTTDAAYTPPITITLSYDEADVVGPEANLRLYHYEGGAWTDVTVLPVDTVNNIITGQVNTLSPFGIISFGGGAGSSGANTNLLIAIALLAITSGLYLIRRYRLRNH
jgi:hypothetical protein